MVLLQRDTESGILSGSCDQGGKELRLQQESEMLGATVLLHSGNKGKKTGQRSQEVSSNNLGILKAPTFRSVSPLPRYIPPGCLYLGSVMESRGFPN